MIRFAVEADVPAIMEMLRKFTGSFKIKNQWSEEKLEKVVRDLINPNSTAEIFIVDGKGFLAAAIHPALFGSDLQATEVGWWVEPEARKEGVGNLLRETFEDWAKSKGCSRCNMSCMDEEVLKYYLKNGYSLYEYSCIKDL